MLEAQRSATEPTALVRRAMHFGAAPLLGIALQPLATVIAYDRIGPTELGRWPAAAALVALGVVVLDVSSANAEIEAPGAGRRQGTLLGVVFAVLATGASAASGDPVFLALVPGFAANLMVGRRRAALVVAKRTNDVARGEIAALVASLCAMVAVVVATGNVLALAVVIPVRGLVFLATTTAPSHPAVDGRAASRIVPFAGLQLLGSGVRNIDFLLVGWLVGEAEAGIYFAGFAVTAAMFDQACLGVTRATLASALEQHPQPSSLFRTSTGLALGLAALASVGWIVVGRTGLGILLPDFGDGGAIEVGTVLAATFPLIALRPIITGILLAEGSTGTVATLHGGAIAVTAGALIVLPTRDAVDVATVIAATTLVETVLLAIAARRGGLLPATSATSCFVPTAAPLLLTVGALPAAAFAAAASIAAAGHGRLGSRHRV